MRPYAEQTPMLQSKHRHPPLRTIGIVFIALVASPQGMVASSTSFTLGPAVLASGPSSFAGCTVGAVPGADPPSFNYFDTALEPFVAVNPINPNNIIGVYQQDRWSDGAAKGLVTSRSFDGGLTWSQNAAEFSICSGGTAANGGDYERTSDPWITFAPNGDAYQIALTFNESNGLNGILVSKSTNGGDTWGEPVTLVRDDGNAAPFLFQDKESITADPVDANYVYAVWNRSRFPSDQANLDSLHAISFRGDIMFSRTTNGGASWEAARAIFAPRANQFSIGNQIVVLPNGVLVDVTFIGQGSTGQRSAWDVAVLRSTDRGATWSAPIKVSGVQAVPVRDPDTGQLIRTGDILPEIAVDRASGVLYAVWQDARFSLPPTGHAYAGIALSRSTDRGLHWSAPVQVNTVPSVQAFTPSVEVAADGTVAVLYYDFRNNDPAPGLPTDVWLTHSHDGGVTWTEQHVYGPFDMEKAPNARGLFVGDYEGLTAIGNDLMLFFSVAGAANDSASVIAVRANRTGP